jgi:VCBS repeat-containing protein
VLDGAVMGSVTANAGGTLSLSFNANATQARVNEVIQSIAYANASDAPPASVQIGWTFNDGNTGGQGTGSALSAVGTTTINITAVNDPAVIGGTDSASLTETNAAQTTGGTLTISDVDGTASFVAQSNVAGSNGYGSFSVASNGVWSYTMGSAHDEFDAGVTYTDSFTVAAADGTSHQVTVSITGSNDVASLTSDTKALTETDAALSTSGTLSLTDADTTAATVTPQTNTAGIYGQFSINAAGAWTYTTLSALNQLNDGQVVTDVFTVTTTDGGSATVTITITGTNDVASLTSDAKALTETDAALSTSGTLTLTDADTTAATVVAQTNTAASTAVSVNAAGAGPTHHQRPRPARRQSGGDRQLHRHHH